MAIYTYTSAAQTAVTATTAAGIITIPVDTANGDWQRVLNEVAAGTSTLAAFVAPVIPPRLRLRMAMIAHHENYLLAKMYADVTGDATYLNTIIANIQATLNNFPGVTPG